MSTPTPKRPPRPKRRVKQHLHGEFGVTRVRSVLPSHWVVRELNPDYGLDVHIETFAKVPENETVWEALGEHVFAQVKNEDGVKITTITPYRGLDSKPHDLLPAETAEDIEPMQVVSYSLETDEIETIRQMGSAVPVLLLVVDKKTGTTYYICLNDWIAKVLPVFCPEWRDQKSVVVHIPVGNVLSSDGRGWNYLSILAKRPKYYGAFVEFGKYVTEMHYAFRPIDYSLEISYGATPDLTSQLRSYKRLFQYYYDELTDLDIWPSEERPGFGVFALLDENLEMAKAELDEVPDDWSDPETRDRSRELLVKAMGLVEMFLNSISSAPQNYGLFSRNWNLPTQLAQIIRTMNGD